MVIGRLGRPRGVRGEIDARPSGATLATIAPGEVVEVRPRQGAPRRLTVAGRGGSPGRLALAFEGVVTRDQAAALTGSDLAVPADRVAVPEDPDTFLVADLIGCAVLVGDRPLGEVRDVIAAPANDVLQVATADGPVLVPFTADAVTALDVAGRRIVIRPDLLATD